MNSDRNTETFDLVRWSADSRESIQNPASKDESEKVRMGLCIPFKLKRREEETMGRRNVRVQLKQMETVSVHMCHKNMTENICAKKRKDKSEEETEAEFLNQTERDATKMTKIHFRNKKRSTFEAFLSVFIIHIHIDRFLIQHGFDSVIVVSA